MRTLDAVYRTWKELWPKETDGGRERESLGTLLSARITAAAAAVAAAIAADDIGQ